MATPTLKWPLRIGCPKTTGDTPMSSDNEGPNPNAKYTPTFFTIKHYKWLLQYHSSSNFTWFMDTPTLPGAMTIILLWNGHRIKDLKWDQLTKTTRSGNTYSMELYFAVHPHPPQTRCSRSMWCHTMLSVELGIQLRPRKPTTRPSTAGGNIGDNRGNNFCRGGASKIKDQDWQKIFYLYYSGIFSGISFEMQNGLPSRMHEFSITQGVSDSFQMSTTQGLTDSFQVATAKDPHNYELKEDGIP
jgi:hypothetical protein